MIFIDRLFITLMVFLVLASIKKNNRDIKGVYMATTVERQIARDKVAEENSKKLDKILALLEAIGLVEDKDE